jgi:hypothetical protein
MKTKVVEAFASKTLVIGTKEAVSGLDVVAGKHYYAIETMDEAIDYIHQAFADEDGYRSVVDSAFAFISENFSPRIAVEALRGVAQEGAS